MERSIIVAITSKDLKPLDKEIQVEINPQTKISKKAWSFMEKWFGYIAIVVASVVYLFWGWFDLVEKDTTILAIIASSAIILAFGYFINQFFRIQALIDMAKAEEITKAEMEHDSKIAEAEPYYEYSDDWTEVETANALRNARMYIMASAALSYSLYFDENGLFIGEDKIPSLKVQDKAKKARNKEIVHAINKARYFKLTPLTITDLTSSESVSLDPHKFGRDKKRFQREENRKDFITKILFALVFGYFGVKMLDNPSWGTLMETALQVVFFYLTGAVTYYTTTAYMMGEYRGSVIKKTRYLSKFINWVKQNQVKLNEVKQHGSNSQNATATSGGTQEPLPSIPSTNHA